MPSSSPNKLSFANNILVVSKNWIGDAVCVTPAIKTIKKHFPSCSLSVLSDPRCAEVFSGNKDIDEIIEYRQGRGAGGLFSYAAILKTIVSKRFDTVFIFHRSRSTALIMYLARVRNRIGYGTKGRRVFLTHSVRQPERDIHMVDHHLSLLRQIGLECPGKDSVFAVSKTDKDEAEKLIGNLGIKKGERFVVINPGGNWDRKRWPAGSFARAADTLSSDCGVNVVITGGEKDVSLAGKIAAKMKKKAFIAAGKTTLKTFGALILKSDLYIGNDSGPTHIAAALKVPLIAVFGPTSPDLTGPVGGGFISILKKETGCAVPCYQKECGHYKCIESVSVEDVVGEAKKVLDAAKKR